jgi:hypothetical protein
VQGATGPSGLAEYRVVSVVVSHVPLLSRDFIRLEPEVDAFAQEVYARGAEAPLGGFPMLSQFVRENGRGELDRLLAGTLELRNMTMR